MDSDSDLEPHGKSESQTVTRTGHTTSPGPGQGSSAGPNRGATVTPHGAESPQTHHPTRAQKSSLSHWQASKRGTVRLET